MPATRRRPALEPQLQVARVCVVQAPIWGLARTLARDGSLRVFMEDVLLDDHFGAAGLWGTIGWARYHADPAATIRHQPHKLDLYRRLSRLVPYVAFGEAPSDWWTKASFRFHRSRVPHQELQPDTWLKAVA